jgi:hypothetical protein
MSHGPARAYGSIDEVIGHAIGHARNRLLHACEAISMTAGLALQWRKPYTPLISLKGAEVQDATAHGGEQAAHVLPGQILIDGKPPWTLAGGDAMKVAWLARFMVTSAVPVSFNTADSAAEAAGLKEAFRQACERAWSNAVAGGRDLTPNYETFLADAGRAFQSAEHGKRAKEAAASSKGATRASEDRLLESVILRAYKAHGASAREANRLFPMTARAS